MHPTAHQSVDDDYQSFARTVSSHTSVGPFRLIRVDSIRYRRNAKQLAVLHRGLIIDHPRSTGQVVHEGHRVKDKVTGAKRVGNSYSRSVKLRSAITPVL